MKMDAKLVAALGAATKEWIKEKRDAERRARIPSGVLMSWEGCAVVHQPDIGWWVHGAGGWQFSECGPPGWACYLDDTDSWMKMHGHTLPLPAPQ